MNRAQRNKIIGLYFEQNTVTQAQFREMMIDKYLEEADNDLEEALALMAFRYRTALSEESYEECAILKDIFEYFEYIPGE